MKLFISKSIKARKRGFTIIELLIVIVVIGILATIGVAAYPGIQRRANEAKINADLGVLREAITLARASEKKSLIGLIGINSEFNACAGCACRYNMTEEQMNNNTIPKTSTCWTNYTQALDIISEKSGINVRELLDPWGRPYDIDQNEGEYSSMSAPPVYCRNDWIGAFNHPYQSSGYYTPRVTIPFYAQKCTG